MAQFDFPKSVKLLKPADFDHVFAGRSSSGDGLIVLYVARSRSERPRLGLVVSKKCGNAVIRNRWKRALREAFRLVQSELPRNVDLVVLPRPKAKPDVAKLQNSFKQLASRGAAKLAAHGERESTS